MISDYAADLLQSILEYLPRVITALITFGVCVAAANALARWIKNSSERFIERPEVATVLSQTARWLIIGLGTLSALEQLDFDVTTFVASLGIAGLTIGFALQDITRNYIAGVILLVRQPFKVGDAVKIGDYAGSVLAMETRDITMRTWTGEMVILPNTLVYEETITNYAQSQQRCRTLRVGLGYGQDLDRAMALLLDAVRTVDGVLEEPAPSVYAEELGDYAITVAIRLWLDTTQSNLLLVHSQAAKAIERAIAESEIDMPYPIQTIELPERRS